MRNAFSGSLFLPQLVTLAVICGLTASCVAREARRAGGLDATVAEVLWLPSDVRVEEDAARPVMIKNRRSIYIDGSASIVFSIERDRDELSRDIVEHFAAAGWRQRQTQYLNPQLPTSFQGGWQVHGGGVLFGETNRTISYEPYCRWHGEWTDERAHIVTYAIGGQGRSLRGIASYVPRSVVEEGLRKLGR